LEVLAIEPNSPASPSQLTPGQIVISCDGLPVSSAEDLRSRIAVAELDTPLVLEVAAESGRRQVELTATTWPTELASSLPPKYSELESSMSASFVDVNVGDFPNKAFALVPPLATQRSLGILILFPQPGELPRESVEEAWGRFVTEQGWIVAVINSANPQRWSGEELELAGRVLGRMKNAYKIDRARTALAGLGVGGRMAVLAANMQPDKVNAVVTIGTDLGRLRIRRSNSPLQTVDYLLIGDGEALRSAAENLDRNGYVATVLDSDGLEPQRLETHPQQPLQIWLEGLARF
jgi:hypothetical protein